MRDNVILELVYDLFFNLFWFYEKKRRTYPCLVYLILWKHVLTYNCMELYSIN